MPGNNIIGKINAEYILCSTEEPAMTHVFVTYTFENQEKRDAFYSELTAEKLDEKSRADRGCIQYKYYYPIGEDNVIFLHEKWEDRDALAEHAAQPHMPLIGALKEKYGAQAEVVKQDLAE